MGNDQLPANLEEFIASNDYVTYACILSSDGGLIAEATGPEGIPEKKDELVAVMLELIRSYPREDLSKIFLDDDSAIVVLNVLSMGILLVTARKDAPLGVVTVSVGKLASKLG